MKLLNSISALILFLAAFTVHAQTDFINAKDFMALTKTCDKLVIVDANKPKNYDVNHIKGAINIYHNDLYQEGDIKGLIKSPGELAAFFGEKGINENSRIVVYDDGSQKYSTRVYWVLKYLGANKVEILHKDLDDWRAARVPLTAAPGKYDATTFSPNVNISIYANIDDVRDRKDLPGVILIDCRTADEFNKPKNYDVNHIKGAINIYHNDLYQEGDIKGLIKSPGELAAFFGEKGINENSRIVVYDDGSQKYSTRVYWVLKYLGANKVEILHKDLDDWRAARVPLTAAPGKYDATTFSPNVNISIYANIDDVRDRKDLPGVILIDCRTADEFNGLKKSDGHIPGAINLNYADLLTETGAFKSPLDLKTMAADYGITADTEIILYCRTSVRAAVAFVAFQNILGFENVKVYDGAYLEWAANHPVVQ